MKKILVYRRIDVGARKICNYLTITTPTMNHFINTHPAVLATVLFNAAQYEVLQDVNQCYYLRGLGWVEKQLCETVPIVRHTLPKIMKSTVN